MMRVHGKGIEAVSEQAAACRQKRRKSAISPENVGFQFLSLRQLVLRIWRVPPSPGLAIRLAHDLHDGQRLSPWHEVAEFHVQIVVDCLTAALAAHAAIVDAAERRFGVGDGKGIDTDHAGAD